MSFDTQPLKISGNRLDIEIARPGTSIRVLALIGWFITSVVLDGKHTFAYRNLDAR